MLAAAVVSEEFREVLLRDPLSALEIGYNGISFLLTAEEQNHISNIRASSLVEFATQLKRI